jgi:hypothetical protein
VERIYSLKNPVDRATAAGEAFGKKFGKDIIPIINEFKGDLPGLIEHLDKMGLLLKDKDAVAAHEFEVQMGMLHRQFSLVARTIGFELIPVFKDMASSISGWLVKNKGEIKDWADNLIFGIKEASANWERYKALLEAVGDVVSVNAETMTKDEANARAAARQLIYDRANAYDRGEHPPEQDFGEPYLPGGKRSGEEDKSSETDPTGKGSGTNDFKLSPRAKAMVDAADKLGISVLDLAGIIGFETGGTYSPSKRGGEGGKFLGLVQFGPEEQKQFGVTAGQSFAQQMQSVVKFFQTRFAAVGKDTAGASLLDLYKTVLAGNPNASGTAKDAFGTSPLSGVNKIALEHRAAALKKFFGGEESNVPGDSGNAKELAGYASEEKKAYDERKKHFSDYVEWLKTEDDKYGSELERRTAYELERRKHFNDYVGKLKDDDDKYAEQLQRETDAETKRKEHFGEYVQEIEEKQRQYDEEQDRQAQEKLENTRNTTVGSGSAISSIGELQQHFIDQGNTAAIAGIQALSDAFAGLGEAVGQVVEAWVLYGSAGTSVRKVTAQILAGVAQQAAIKAVFELAEGFAALAMSFFGIPNAGPSATAHFAAAAIYGSIAGIAAVAGRAVAGDSFKNQAATSTGKGGAAGGAGSAGSGSPSGESGHIYSQKYGDDATILNIGRNQSEQPVQQHRVTVELGLRGDGVLEILHKDIRNNGRTKAVLVDVIAANS